jgi:hypothetical protein
MGRKLDAIVQRRELGTAVAAFERKSYQEIGEHWILGQQRAVDVCPKGIPDSTPLSTVLSIIAKATGDPTQRRCVAIEVRPATMILEADEVAAGPVDLDVADTARHAVAWVDRLHGEYLEAVQPPSIRPLVESAHHLIATADRQDRHVRLNGPMQTGPFPAEQVFSNPLLLAILSTTHEDQVVSPGIEIVTEPTLANLKCDPALLTAPSQAIDIATIAIQIHQRGIEVRQSQRPAACFIRHDAVLILPIVRSSRESGKLFSNRQHRRVGWEHRQPASLRRQAQRALER